MIQIKFVFQAVEEIMFPALNAIPSPLPGPHPTQKDISCDTRQRRRRIVKVQAKVASIFNSSKIRHFPNKPIIKRGLITCLRVGGLFLILAERQIKLGRNRRWRSFHELLPA